MGRQVRGAWADEDVAWKSPESHAGTSGTRLWPGCGTEPMEPQAVHRAAWPMVARATGSPAQSQILSRCPF